MRLGAWFLLVHIPAASDPIGYAEAERRLIRRYTPALNEQFISCSNIERPKSSP